MNNNNILKNYLKDMRLKNLKNQLKENKRILNDFRLLLASHSLKVRLNSLKPQVYLKAKKEIRALKKSILEASHNLTYLRDQIKKTEQRVFI